MIQILTYHVFALLNKCQPLKDCSYGSKYEQILICSYRSEFFTEQILSFQIETLFSKVVLFRKAYSKSQDLSLFNPNALRKAKIVYNFGLSECNRVKDW